jgi:hypothetical protein
MKSLDGQVSLAFLTLDEAFSLRKERRRLALVAASLLNYMREPQGRQSARVKSERQPRCRGHECHEALWLLDDDCSGETTKQPGIHQKVAQRCVRLRQLELVDRMSGIREDAARHIGPRSESFELLKRQRSETGNVILVGDAVHLDVDGQRRPWFRFSWPGAVSAVVVVEVVEVIDHAVHHRCEIFHQLDLTFGAFFEHSRTGALEVLGLRCYEAAVDVVLFAVAENGEV